MDENSGIPGEAAISRDFEIGQSWTYRTRPGENQSVLTIRGKDEHPIYGTIFHLTVLDVVLRPGQREVPHLAISEEALNASVVHPAARGAPLSHFETEYAEWLARFRAGRANVYSVPVAEALTGIEKTQTAIDAPEWWYPIELIQPVQIGLMLAAFIFAITAFCQWYFDEPDWCSSIRGSYIPIKIVRHIYGSTLTFESVSRDPNSSDIVLRGTFKPGIPSMDWSLELYGEPPRLAPVWIEDMDPDPHNPAISRFFMNVTAPQNRTTRLFWHVQFHDKEHQTHPLEFIFSTPVPA